jgi:hypothetical protein
MDRQNKSIFREKALHDRVTPCAGLAHFVIVFKMRELEISSKWASHHLSNMLRAVGLDEGGGSTTCHWFWHRVYFNGSELDLINIAHFSSRSVRG